MSTDRNVAIFTHEAFKDHDTGCHPECTARIAACEEALRQDEDLADRIRWESPAEAPDDAILRCHSEDHLRVVRRTEGRRGYLDPDTLFSPASYRAIRLSAGAAIAAAECCYRGECEAAFCLSRPPGHHATPHRAMGFCFLNNIAIAARHLQSLGCERILIVDWDVHHGNGTQEIFYRDPTVFYYSLHQYPHYPGTGPESDRGEGDGEGTTLNRPLPRGFPAEEYREVFAADLERIAKEFDPQLALVSAGFDSHLADPLGGLTLTEDDFAWLTGEVRERMGEGRVVSFLEGGYNLEALARSAVAHVKAYL
ncbi:MAG: histone deacetylase [Planctomycetes bacterium]|nr:histone deacetylase [Planctomycetota bacterium]